MIFEILYTVEFIAAFLKNSKYVSKSKYNDFKRELTKILIKHYANHWDESNPSKFKKFRSIKFNYYIDNNILKAWTITKLPNYIAKLLFPTDLLIYCDPRSVTYIHKHSKKTLFISLTHV